MMPALAVLIACYCEARLFDQLMNGKGWTTRIVALMAMLGVAFSAVLLIAIGETAIKFLP